MFMMYNLCSANCWGVHIYKSELAVFFCGICLGACLCVTLPETNIAPENGPSQKESNIPTIHFQGRAVRFRGGQFVFSSRMPFKVRKTCQEKVTSPKTPSILHSPRKPL